VVTHLLYDSCVHFIALLFLTLSDVFVSDIWEYEIIARNIRGTKREISDEEDMYDKRPEWIFYSFSSCCWFFNGRQFTTEIYGRVEARNIHYFERRIEYRVRYSERFASFFHYLSSVANI
jgi:hypothetical protein